MWLRQVGVQRSVKEVMTMKKLLGCLSMAALAVVLASPVSAQSITLKVSVPFDFSVGGHTLPAGDYLVSTVNITGSVDSGFLAVRNVSSGATPAVITSIPAGRLGASGQASVAFHHYGSDYFLATIWDGYTGQGRSIPMSHTEQERVNQASLSTPQAVMVLARR
jgi:hypothetical protein